MTDIETLLAEAHADMQKLNRTLANAKRANLLVIPGIETVAPDIDHSPPKLKAVVIESYNWIVAPIE